MIDDASILREILARECDTVNQYVLLAQGAKRDDVKRLVLHLAMEEKEHIAECARLLASLDEEYAAFMRKPLSHALGDDAPKPTVQPPSPADVSPAQPAPSPPTQPAPAFAARAPGLPGHGAPILGTPFAFTVGSLISK